MLSIDAFYEYEVFSSTTIRVITFGKSIFDISESILNQST